jgi:large subunit ribosomal protein L17
MRHHNQNRKLSRVRKVRVALINSLARSLILHGKIETTEPKAKEIRPFVEKLVTKSKLQTVAARRTLVAKVGAGATKILMSDIFKKYEKRNGGFLRITKIKNRLSDGSKMAIIEFI